MNVPALPGNSLALVFRPSQREGVDTTSIRSFNGIRARVEVRIASKIETERVARDRERLRIVSLLTSTSNGRRQRWQANRGS